MRFTEAKVWYSTKPSTLPVTSSVRTTFFQLPHPLSSWNFGASLTFFWRPFAIQ